MQPYDSAPSPVSSSRQHQHQPQYNNHSSNMMRAGGRPDTTTAGDARDQQHEQQEQQQLSLQQELDVPITYMPFKFENRRVRIDWRLLHGVDIDKLIRDTDLDTLEQLVTCVTWGDIEAEDTRHLSEGNFVKVFRLAQLLLEYLLYVQENLKFTNGVLDKSRCTAVLHAQSLSTRCRDLYTQLKSCKRDLKRAHKTVKTFELMAAAVGGAAAAAQAAQAKQQSAQQQQQQQQQQEKARQEAKQEAAAAMPQQQQQQQAQGAFLTAGEVMLQSQLTELTERLTLAVAEAERLRSERQELQYQIRHLHDTLAAKLGNRGGIFGGVCGSGDGGSGGGGLSRISSRAAREVEAATAAAEAAAQERRQALFMAELQCAQAQIEELNASNKELREQLKQSDAAAAAAAAAASTAAAAAAQPTTSRSLSDLEAQLEQQARELARLQGELREREASIGVFQTTNATLQAQIDALQRQLASPEATTPSFVAKQRQQLAAAASAHAGLQSENATLRQELLELRLAVEAAGGGGGGVQVGGASGHKGSTAATGSRGGSGGGEEDEEDTLAAAERLLSGGDDDEGGGMSRSSTKGVGGGAGGGASDWKVQEIGRLQADNKQLQAKVASLQEALYDLETANARLEKRLTAAAAAGFVAAAGTNSAAASPVAGNSPAAKAAAAAVVGSSRENPAVAADGGGGLLLGGAGGSGWASVSSSGPAAELTAADLATGATNAAAAAVRGGGAAGGAGVANTTAAAAGVGVGVEEQQLEQFSVESFGEGVDAAAEGVAAAAVGGKAAAGADVVGGAAGVVLGSEGSHIPAYRPSRGDTAGGADPTAAAAVEASGSDTPLSSSSNGVVVVGADSASSNGMLPTVLVQTQLQPATAPAAAAGGVGAAAVRGGAIDQAAAQQLRGLVAQLQAQLTPGELEAEYAEVCCDWDKPFDLTDDEKTQFRSRLPGEVEGLSDVLCGERQCTAEEVAAARPRMLPAINRFLDGQLASYGIHPGRTGLSNVELLAAMKMLSERREAMESSLTPQQRSDVEVARLGLLLHPYHALQATLAGLPAEDGQPDGRKRLPVVAPVLTSAVRPPGSSSSSNGGVSAVSAASAVLPPPPIRLLPSGPSPLGSPTGFGMTATGTMGGSSAAVAAGTAAYSGGGGVNSSSSPQAAAAAAAAGGGVGGAAVSSALMLTHLRPPSPLSGSEAAREGIQKATAAGSFSPLSAALHAKQQLMVGGGSPVSAARSNRSVSPGAGGGGGSSTATSPAGYHSTTTVGGGSVGYVAGVGSSPTKLQQQVVQLSPRGMATVGAAGVAYGLVAQQPPTQPQQQQVVASQAATNGAAAVATKQYLETFDVDSDDF